MKVVLRPLLLAFIATCAACGFHLRGQIEMPEQMHHTYIQGDGGNVLMRNLRFALTTAGVNVVDEVEEASAILHIIAAKHQRRVLSVSGRAIAREFELSFTVTLKVLTKPGKKLLPEQNLTVVRDYRFDQDDVLGKSGEEGLIREEMERDIVQLIVRRLEKQGGAGDGQ